LTEILEAHLRRQIEHSQRFFWQRLRWRAVRGYLPVDAPFNLVDVGAGAGLLGSFLQRDRPSASYRFAEPIDSLRGFLKEQFGAQADMTNATDYGNVQFVTLLDVLEHQEFDEGFLDGLVGKMAFGSILLLTVPAMKSLWSQWDVALGHFRRYDKRSLLQCVQGLPLSVLEVSFLFPEMVPLAMVRARRGAENHADENGSAEFPDLPALVNDALYGLGTASLTLRKKWAFGTSLFLAAQVTQ
jgi:hypothetical protein